MSKEAGNVIENVTTIKIPDKLKDGKKEIDMCLALREIIEEENIKIIKKMEEEKAAIIKDSERKISDATNDAIVETNIRYVLKGKISIEEAALDCGLTLEEFLKKKEGYENSLQA